jgi:hypothetical protein
MGQSAAFQRSWQLLEMGLPINLQPFVERVDAKSVLLDENHGRAEPSRPRLLLGGWEGQQPPHPAARFEYPPQQTPKAVEAAHSACGAAHALPGCHQEAVQMLRREQDDTKHQKVI